MSTLTTTKGMEGTFACVYKDPLFKSKWSFVPLSSDRTGAGIE